MKIASTGDIKVPGRIDIGPIGPPILPTDPPRVKVWGHANILGNMAITGDVNANNVSVADKLTVAGAATFNSDVKIATKLSMGSGTDLSTIKYVPATSTFPGMLKFSPPGGNGPFGGPPGSGVAPENAVPNLTCLNGAPTPGFVNTFSQMLSIVYSPTNSAITGGQLLLGHNGVNAFFETQGTGAAPGNVNHPGDLFINKFCNRNVLFFGHSTPFGAGATNIVSIDGSLNVRTKMQLGDFASTGFADAGSKLYVLNAVGGNGIRIKHGALGGNGIKIATYQDVTAFVVSKSNNSTSDGSETFKVEGDGRTYIGIQRPIATGPHGDAMLAVDGKILAKEIFVNIHNSTWADYVFNKDYKLMPLTEVEKFVSKNHHLPNVPAEKELLEKDLNLAEMQKIQMEKIEELYLYVIQQQKEIEFLKAKNKELEQKIK